MASFVFTKDEAAAIEGQFDYIHRPKSPHEKVFAELTSGKDLKNAMHLKGPEEADVKELLEEIDSGTDKGAVKDRREQYARLRRLLGAARQRMEQTDGL